MKENSPLRLEAIVSQTSEHLWISDISLGFRNLKQHKAAEVYENGTKTSHKLVLFLQ